MKSSIYPEFPIILVDDEEQALDSFEIALRSANMNHFVRCQDSRDVMMILAAGEVEVMLLDLRMPYLSGEDKQRLSRNSCYCHYRSKRCGNRRKMHEKRGF